MRLKLLSAAALAAAIASSAAFAQQNPSTTGDPSATDKVPALEDPAIMTPFFTDDSMSTLRSTDEFRAAWMAMTPENQTAVKEECKTTDSIKMKEFCNTVGTM